MTHLKPCPFCGGEAEIWRATPGTTRKAWIACMAGCIALTKEHETDDLAVAAWNRRVVVDRIEALEEALRPFADLSAKLTDEGSVLEVCRPHPENPSRRIEPFATHHLRHAARTLAG